jgi:hypothetical protein
MARDFEWLRGRVSTWLNFNPGQTNQDFTQAQIDGGINDAYHDEVNTARLQGNPNYFKMKYDLAWTAGEVTKTLPKFLVGVQVYDVTDITSDDPGCRIAFDKDGRAGNVTYRDRETLQWGATGPGQDTTLRFFYLAEPVDMSEDGEEPSLVPPAHRGLIALSAAVSLRDMADEGAPQAWLLRLHDQRLDFWKATKLGRPMTDVPVVTNDYSDTDIGYIL